MGFQKGQQGCDSKTAVTIARNRAGRPVGSRSLVTIMKVVGARPTKYVNEFGKEIEIPKDTAVIYELFRICQDRDDSRQLKAIQIYMDYHTKVLNYIRMQEEIEKLEMMFKYLTESGMPINDVIKNKILGNSLHNGNLDKLMTDSNSENKQLPVEVMAEVTSESQQEIVDDDDIETVESDDEE